MRIGIFGSGGFIGSAIFARLVSDGHDVLALPRVDTYGVSECSTQLTPQMLQGIERISKGLTDSLVGLDVIVNCAGAASPDARNLDEIWEVNSLLPMIVGTAAGLTGATLVHVSSAAVQGNMPVLDESPDHLTHSPYATSKALAETWLLASDIGKNGKLVIYRPTSVVALGTRKLERVVRAASWSLTPKIGAGTAKLPLITVDSVAKAVATLVHATSPLPAIALHPFEGITQAELIRSAGRGSGVVVPTGLAMRATSALNLISSRWASLQGPTRRIELFVNGQDQDCSALERLGYTPTPSSDITEMVTQTVQGRTGRGRTHRFRSPRLGRKLNKTER